MPRIRTSSLVLLPELVFLIAPAAWGQQTSAPVPSQIVAAKKVFIANAGADAASPVDFKRARGPSDLTTSFISL
jgi:hypothetical protein